MLFSGAEFHSAEDYKNCIPSNDCHAALHHAEFV